MLRLPGQKEGGLVTLSGNTRPEATAINDRGPVADDFRLEHMMLLLRRSAPQEQALEQYIEQLTDPHSPNYHRWLTAQEFGERYGLAQGDLDSIIEWLESCGFTVNGVYSNHVLIDFSGTVGMVRQAFHTEIHHLLVNGEKHIANMSDPMIPAELGAKVIGVVSLNDFRPHPLLRRHPNYTASNQLLLAPKDLATIYNLTAVFEAGYSGQGQTIYVIEDSDALSSDWDKFRSEFGLASAYPDGSFVQTNPAPRWIDNCLDPGTNAAEDEAIGDAEWASAAAPSATIVLASCADLTTAWSTTAPFGGFTALQNILDSGVPPAVVSISYGDSETDDGEAYNAAIYLTYQQAVAEGFSVFVSSGDEAAAVSDRGATAATHGINVNGWGSTPYNVAVGGTDFGDTYAGTNSTYWSSTNDSNYGSALSYVPEIPWNDSCASTLIAQYVTGSSVTYGSKGFCNNLTIKQQPLLTVDGGSGGPSGCASGAPSTPGVVSGTCAGYAKPSWQSVFGNPSDGVRDLPDVSLFAGDGIWGHSYVVCFSDTAQGGTSCSGAPSTWTLVGGTSIASPIMAGVQSLVNQAAGTVFGNPNPHYYALAAAEYGATGNASCNSSLGNALSSDCIFYDVTMGDIDAPCQGWNNCYLPSGTNGVLSTSNSSYMPAYAATPGWDFATGIGTVNAYNLVKALAVPPAPVVSFAPPSVFLGSEALGTNSMPQRVMLKNVGDASLTINSYSIGGGNSTDFSVSSTCPGTLPANSSCSFSVYFDPTAAGPRKSALIVNDNAPGNPHEVLLTGVGSAAVVSPSTLGFGTVTVGTSSSPQNATIANNGSATMQLWQIVITGANAGDFSITANSCGTTLAGSASCTVSVTFKPTATGTRTASLLFSDDGGGSPQAAALTGSGD
jgi:hypothetical protein